MTSAVFKTYEPSKTPEKTVWYQIGLPSRGQALYQVVQEGVPYTTYTKLVELSGADVKKLSEMLAIPLTTVNRRAKSGRFSTHESDRIVQFVEVYEAAVRLFEGDREAARQWMKSPVKGLGGKAPMQMLSTGVELDAVLDMIGRLEHGIVA